MKTFKQLLKETIEVLKEDFNMATAFGEENIKKEKGQSASAYQQIVGVLENMPEIDKILSKRCGNVRAGEIIAMCYKIFKHFNSKGEECNNITYDPKNDTYSANRQKNFGVENKNLVSINKDYILHTIKASNKEFNKAIITIQSNLDAYSYGTYDLGQTITCKNQNFFKIDDNKITIRVPADTAQNSTRDLNMHEESRDFIATITNDGEYKCFKINNSENYIFVSPSKSYGIFVITNDLTVERPYLTDPGLLQGIVRGLADKINAKLTSHSNTSQHKNIVNRNNKPTKAYIYTPPLLMAKARKGDKEALNWWQQLRKIATKYNLDIKESKIKDTVDLPDKFYDIKEIGDLIDKVNSYLDRF